MNVIEYCTEEVKRQGHDIMQMEGIQRVGYMLRAWEAALAASHRKPEMEDAIELGKMIEPEQNRKGIRVSHVIIGEDHPPRYEFIPGMLHSLFTQRDSLTPLEFYKAFEHIHPFLDGNGRTGKVLLNWLNGTLLDPIFPPHDLFGRWISNP